MSKILNNIIIEGKSNLFLYNTNIILKDIVNTGLQLSSKKENLYQPEDVANKIFEMIKEHNTFRNGQVEEFYSGTR